jgi:hypothetical protein
LKNLKNKEIAKADVPIKSILDANSDGIIDIKDAELNNFNNGGRNCSSII